MHTKFLRKMSAPWSPQEETCPVEGWAHTKSLQSCPTLCDPMYHSPPGSSVHGILQARILEWVAKPSSRGSSHREIKPAFLKSPALVAGFFTTSATREDPLDG